MRENLKLLILFLAIATVILVRIGLEENGFTTPDSRHYMAVATSILQDGDLTYTIGNETRFFSLWPAGYPISIALVSGLTTLSLLWSSKVVNLLWLGLAFFFIQRKYPRSSFWICLVFCSNSLLEIFSYTWSEAGFIVTLLWSSLTLHTIIHDPKKASFFKAANLAAAGLTLFLYRYVGGFILGVVGAFASWMLLKQQYKKVASLLSSALIIAAGIGLYFWFIYSHTGHYSGATRLHPDEPLSYLLVNLFQTQLNELLLIRKISFSQLDYVSAVFLLFQAGLTGYAFMKLTTLTDWRERLKPSPSDSLPLTIASVGAFYWLTVVGLRIFIMKFDSFDFRIMGPASALFLVALHAYLAMEHRVNILAKIQRPLTAIYLVALAHGLYKKQLLFYFLR